jgi:regulator of sigma E protease
MTIIIFIIILGLLVLVHEMGHFLAAKKAGVHVEEFGFGYPPRAISLGRKWGTLFSLNWIPFGGFVKIFGENYEEAKSLELKAKRFTEVSKKWQAIILVAGVTFNILFAWILFSFGFLIGLPTPVQNDFSDNVRDPVLTVVEVLPGSPADDAGLKSGDKIKTVSAAYTDITTVSPEMVSDFISKSEGELRFRIDRGGKILDFVISPEEGLIANKKAVGISMDMVGTLSLPIHRALYEGGRATIKMTYLTAEGLFGLIKDSLVGKADVSNVTGPVGIVGLVGDASRLGLAYLLTFTALISINLAIINLIPFPALDGGRLLFVMIEGLTRKPVNAKFAQTVNGVGFAILIGLMIFVIYRDILKLF